MRRFGVCSPTAALLAAIYGLLAPALALANPWDISLRGLGRPDVDTDALRRYRSLSGELALALSPRPMQPAETLGVSGFEFSLANTLTTISNKADYWQGQAGMPVMEGPVRGRQVPGALWTPTLHVRKGLPFSTEVGVQGTYLANSELFMMGAEAKIALHESFYRWLPAMALRLAVGRLFGSSELDLFTAEGDVLVSQAFGVGGMAQVTPYLGYGQLARHVNSYIIDETPYDVSETQGDQRGGAQGSLYAFPTLNWKHNRTARYFGGIRIKAAMVELLYEANIATTGFTQGRKTISSHTLKLGFDV